MFCTQIVMEAFPNIHLTGMFTLLFAVVFRFKGLIPLYIYVFLIGLRWGFSLSWIPYLYVWLVLWGVGMLIPTKIPKKIAAILYPAIGALHGISFGVLYAPSQAILFGLNFHQTLAWIASGFPFDILHAIGNLAFCTLVLPMSVLFQKLLKKTNFS